MKQFLKNYTSDVPVHRTIGNIEQVLIRCGVTGITKEYSPTAKVIAVKFHIAICGNPLTVRLPADAGKALDAIWKDYVGEDKLTNDGNQISQWDSRKRKKKSDFKEQAERTAWKIVQDWVEVQLSMVNLQQAETLQVFLSYAVIPDGRTYYEAIKQDGFRAMLPEKAGV